MSINFQAGAKKDKQNLFNIWQKYFKSKCAY